MCIIPHVQSDKITSAISEYLKSGGKITVCPTVGRSQDRAAINSRRIQPRKPAKPQPIEAISPNLCRSCTQEHGKPDKRCLKCAHYRQTQLEYADREQIAFDHLPDILIEEIAALPQPDVVERIRQLPLEMSAPLMMQYYLGATLDDIGKYLSISHQAVAKRNKKTLDILRTLIRS